MARVGPQRHGGGNDVKERGCADLDSINLIEGLRTQYGIL